MKNVESCLGIFWFLLISYSSILAQIQDSIPIKGSLITPIAAYDTPEGAFITYGNDQLIKKTFKITNFGVTEEANESFNTESQLLDAVESASNRSGKRIFEDITFYESRFKGTAARGYSYETVRNNIVSQKGPQEAEWEIDLKIADNEFFYKKLAQTFSYDGSKYSILLSGRKIKKDKTKKNNEYKDFEVFIYNGKKLKKYNSQILLDWGVIPNSTGVVTDEKGEHKGFYIEFDLGGGADGLGKMNKNAPPNSKFVSFLDEKGQFIRTVQFSMPLKMSRLNFEEFFVQNVLIINDKLNFYVKTRDYKFGTKTSDWVPGYLHFKEENGNSAKLASNPNYEYSNSISNQTSNPPRSLDLSDKILLGNGDLVSIGSSNGENFAYMRTKPDGQVVKFGYLQTSHDAIEGSTYEYLVKDISSVTIGIAAFLKLKTDSFSEPYKITNDFIYVDKRDGKITPMRPLESTMNEVQFITSTTILNYGIGVKNPKSIHFAYSPNRFDLALKLE